jgi:hypothetical protein
MLDRVKLDRTTLARDDLDWLPPSFKAIRWTVAGTLWAGVAGLLGAAIVVAKPGIFVYGKGLALLFAGGYYAGDKAAKAALRSRLRRLARGQVDLSRLPAEPDGELCHVRGRVRAQTTLTPLLGGAPCVYRRMVFSLGGARWVHEAAEDFFVEDAGGERVLAEVDGARLIAAEPSLKRYKGAAAEAIVSLSPAVPSTVRDPAKRWADAAEVVLREGDEVELVGYKARAVDPSVASVGFRDTPMRATLRSGRELPLLVAPV